MKDKDDRRRAQDKNEFFGHEQGVRLGMRWVVLALWGAVYLGGCGYSLTHRLKDGFTNPEGLYVPVFSNATNEIGAERVFTDAFIREMQSRGQMIITSRRPGAFEVRGEVSRIAYNPTNLTPAGGFNGLRPYRRLPTEIMVEATVSLQLVNPKDGKVLWSGAFSNFRRVPGALSRTYDYQAPSSLPILQQSLVESQYPGIARDIMRDAYDAMLELN